MLLSKKKEGLVELISTLKTPSEIDLETQRSLHRVFCPSRYGFRLLSKFFIDEMTRLCGRFFKEWL